MTQKTVTLALQYTVGSNQAIISSLTALQTATVAEQLLAAKLSQQFETIDRAGNLKRLAADAANGVLPLSEVVKQLDLMSATDIEVRQLAKDMDNLAASTAQVGSQATVATQKLSGIHDIGIQLNALPDPEQGAFAGETVGDSGGGGGLRSGLRAGGFLLGSQAGGQDLRAASQIVTLTTNFGLAGTAAGILAVGVRVVTDEIAKNADAEKHRVDVLEQVAQAVANSTTQEVQAKVKASQDDIRVKQIEIGLIEQQTGKSAAYLEQLSQLNVVVDYVKYGQQGLGRELGDTILGFGAAATKVHDANQAITDDNFAIDTYNKVIGENVTVVNDAVAAWKEQQKSIEDSNKALIGLYDQQAQTNTDLAALRRTGTTDEINSELAANKDRETIIQTYLLPNVTKIGLTSAEASAKIIALNSELGDLTLKDQQLLQAVLPVVAAREAETAALKADKDYSDALNQSLQDINKTQVDAANAADKTKEAYAALTLAETDHTNNLKTIQDTYDTAQQDALSKKNTQLAKIDQQAAERQLQQKENDSLSILQAIGRGDLASAQATLAQEKVKDAQDQRQVKQQKDDAQQNYTDALAAAKAQNVKLLASEQDRYTKELAQRRDAYTKAYQDQLAQDRRLAELRQTSAFVDQYWANVTTDAYNKVSTATGGFADQMQSYADRVNADIAARTISGQSGGSAGGATVGSGSGIHETPGGSGTPFPTPYGVYIGNGGTIGSFDNGGISMKPGIFYAGVPEAHIPLSMMGGIKVDVTIDARGSNMSPAEREKLKNETKTELVQAITAIHQGQKH